MPKVRDIDSERAAHPAVAGSFSVPWTQDSIAYGGVQDYDIVNPAQSVAASVAGDQVTFDARTSIGLTDVEHSYVVVKCYWDLNNPITDQDGTVSYATVADMFSDGVTVPAGGWSSGFTYPAGPVVATTGISTAPMFAATLFDDVVLTINGREVVPTLGKAQPYGYFASVVKNRDNGDKEAGKYSEGFIMDGGSPHDTWQARLNRMNYYIYGAGGETESFTLVYRLSNLGFNVTHGSMLPPNVNIRLRMRRTPNNFVLMGPSAALTSINPVLKFANAQLLLARRILDPLAKSEYDTFWLERPIKIPFERVKVEQFPQPAGTTNINIVNCLAGPTPSAVYVMLVRTDTINGTNQSDSAFDLGFAPNNPYWTNASLSLGGGRTYPIQPLNTFVGKNFYNRADVAQMYQMYRSTCNNSGDPFLSSADFMATPILAFQIGTRTDAWDAAEEVSCSFQGNLNTAPFTNQAFTILMVAFVDGLVQIAYSGETAVTSV